jgi:hypothetical protein
LLVVVPFVAGFASGLINAIQGEDYTANEREMRDGLQPMLSGLLVNQSDLASLAGPYESCSENDVADHTIRYEHDGSLVDQPGEVEGATIKEQSTPSAAAAQYCRERSGSAVASVGWLPERKADLLYMMNTFSSIANGDQNDLEAIAKEHARAHFDGRPAQHVARITDAEVGRSGYAYRFDVTDADSSQTLDVYYFAFTRGVFYGAVGVSAPRGEITEAQAISVARSLDRRVAETIDSLAAVSSRSASNGN